MVKPLPRGRPKMTWMEVINKDLKALGICKEDAVNRARWRRLINVGPRGGLLVGR